MKMKAWILEKPAPIESGPLFFKETEIPEPAPGELLIKVSTCGVCHTDLHTVEGELPLPKLPVIPGHQIVGKVVGISGEAPGFRTGDRVGVPWLNWTCGACKFCAIGLENLCIKGKFTGYHVNGGYAEFTVVPHEYACRIPGTFDDIHAAPLLCAGIIGMRALKLGGVKRGEAIGLFGFGASAHIALQIAVGLGARVYVFSRSGAHRRHAMELGALWAGYHEETPPEPLASAISFAPAGSIIPAALEKLDKGGTLALAGIYVDSIPPLDYEKHIFHEKKLLSVTASTRKDAEDLFTVAASIKLRTDVDEYDFASAPEALKKVKHSQISGAAVLRIS